MNQSDQLFPTTRAGTGPPVRFGGRVRRYRAGNSGLCARTVSMFFSHVASFELQPKEAAVSRALSSQV